MSRPPAEGSRRVSRPPAEGSRRTPASRRRLSPRDGLPQKVVAACRPPAEGSRRVSASRRRQSPRVGLPQKVVAACRPPAEGSRHVSRPPAASSRRVSSKEKSSRVGIEAGMAGCGPPFRARAVRDTPRAASHGRARTGLVIHVGFVSPRSLCGAGVASATLRPLTTPKKGSGWRAAAVGNAHTQLPRAHVQLPLAADVRDGWTGARGGRCPLAALNRRPSRGEGHSAHPPRKPEERSCGSVQAPQQPQQPPVGARHGRR